MRIFAAVAALACVAIWSRPLCGGEAKVERLKRAKVGDWVLYLGEDGNKRKSTVTAVSETGISVTTGTVGAKGLLVDVAVEEIVFTELEQSLARAAEEKKRNDERQAKLKKAQEKQNADKKKDKNKDGEKSDEAAKEEAPDPAVIVKDAKYVCTVEQSPAGIFTLTNWYSDQIPVHGLVKTEFAGKVMSRLVDFGWADGGKAAATEAPLVEFDSLAEGADKVADYAGQEIRLRGTAGTKSFAYLVDDAPRTMYQSYKLLKPGVKEPTRFYTYAYVERGSKNQEAWEKLLKNGSGATGLEIRCKAYYVGGKGLAFPVLLLVEEIKEDAAPAETPAGGAAPAGKDGKSDRVKNDGGGAEK